MSIAKPRFVSSAASLRPVSFGAGRRLRRVQEPETPASANPTRAVLVSRLLPQVSVPLRGVRDAPADRHLVYTQMFGQWFDADDDVAVRAFKLELVRDVQHHLVDADPAGGREPDEVIARPPERLQERVVAGRESGLVPAVLELQSRRIVLHVEEVAPKV